jgi:hypothetical protein
VSRGAPHLLPVSPLLLLLLLLLLLPPVPFCHLYGCADQLQPRHLYKKHGCDG